MQAILENLQHLIWAAGVVVTGVLLGVVLHAILLFVVRRFARKTSENVEKFVKGVCCGPSRATMVLILLWMLMPLIVLPERWMALTRQLLSILLISAVAWLVIRAAGTVRDLIIGRYTLDQDASLQGRKVHTQLRVLYRVVVVIVGIIALGSILMTFERVRQLGTSILASAGIIGLVVGVAAQRTIGGVIAGIQIAITQPIRLYDVVIAEGEWGRVEEITLTYVVVRIWDLRRLVLPITYFVEKPFQNWTRISPELLGTVYLYVDYSVPVDALREQLKRILDASEHWDKKVWGLQVTNATERTVELRALMSAVDASTAWNLRCEVRERMIGFIRDRYPQGLPKVRVDGLPANNEPGLLPAPPQPPGPPA